MKQALIYSLKVWITALLFSPTIAFPIWILAEWLISYDKSYSTGIAYGIDINVSAIAMSVQWFVFYYLPYLILLFLSVMYFQRQGAALRYKKLAFTILSIVLTLCPFTFLKVIDSDTVFNIQLARVSSFGLLFIVGVWFYKLKSVDPVTETPTSR